MLFFQQKVSPLFLISRSRSLSPFFSAAYFLFFSVFLLLYIPNLWTWQFTLAQYFRQHGLRNNFHFPFSSLLTLQLPMFFKTWVAIRFRSKITPCCIWVAIPVGWVILHLYACGADGRSLGLFTGSWLPNFLRWVDTTFSYPWSSAARALRVRAPL